MRPFTNPLTNPSENPSQNHTPAMAALAPMAGVTDLPFRLLCREHGCAWSVTEMISAKGLVLSGANREQARMLCEILPQEGCVGAQLFGHEPEIMAEAARRLEGGGASFIDINMGCPVHKVVGGGDGSALMRTPDIAAAVIERVAGAVRLPVSVKIRAGWDEHSVNAVPFAVLCEQSGARMLTVHARTRAQMYAGRADWSVIAAVKTAVGIPVWGNGDVSCGEDALRMLAETRCDGVAVARGAQGNPFLFSEIMAALNGLPYSPPTATRRIHCALRHADMMYAYKGGRLALMEMRKHFGWYLHGLRGAGSMRARINEMTDALALRDMLLRFARECDAHEHPAEGSGQA